MSHRLQIVVAAFFLAAASCLIAGPYAPAAGQPGSTAISKDDAAIIGWATAWRNYQAGANVASTWRTPEKALGISNGDEFDIVCLGDRGQITLLVDGVITNGSGPDFAVFENAVSDGFLELAFVEVSSNGTNFFRFPNRSLTSSPVAGFGTLDPTNVDGLAGKYRKGFGTPFDLADLPNNPLLDKSAIRFVRIIDIVGDGNDLDSTGAAIYDPHPTTGSAGFDLDALAVLNGTPSAVWKSYRLPDFAPETYYLTPALTLLADGRLLMAQGRHYSGAKLRFHLQESWASPRTRVLTADWDKDPSFLAVRDDNQVLIGAGDWGATSVGFFDPLAAGGNLSLTPLLNVQNYAAVWWQNPAPGGSSGWLVSGTNDASGNHGVRFISADGGVNQQLVENFSTYSSGMTLDAAGNLYLATYEVGGPRDRVYRFTVDQLENALSTNQPLERAQGTFIFQFDSAASLAVDSHGRLWAGGSHLNGLIHGYDPATGGSVKLAPQHPTIVEAGSVSYQIRTVMRDGEGHLVLLARDAFDISRQAYIVHAPAKSLIIPHQFSNWSGARFGEAIQDPSLEESVWGPQADPDGNGVVNFLEYAFGGEDTWGDHSLTNAELLPAVFMDAGNLGIEFMRDRRTADIRIIVEASSDLSPGSWQSIAVSEAGGETFSLAGLSTVMESGDGWVCTVRVTDSQTLHPGAPRRFMRVRVQSISPAP